MVVGVALDLLDPPSLVASSIWPEPAVDLVVMHVIAVPASMLFTYAHAAPLMVTKVTSWRCAPRIVTVSPPSTGPTLGVTESTTGAA